MRLMMTVFPAAAIALLSVAALFTSVAATDCCAAQKSGDAATQKTPIACSLTNMNAAQRKRHTQLRTQMREEVKESKELSDGYGFRFTADAKTIRDLAEFVSLERLCCPFFKFELTVESDNGPVWLSLSGAAGVKEFLRAEFASR